MLNETPSSSVQDAKAEVLSSADGVAADAEQPTSARPWSINS